MKLGLIIYGSLETVSGGYLYDRMLVSQLRRHGDEVELISLPPSPYGRQLLDNFTFRQPQGLDLILQDELCHPSLVMSNGARHSCPTISIVHNLRSARGRVPQDVLYRIVERSYLERVDGFIFNSVATRASVWAAIGRPKPHVVAPPGGDRLGEVNPAMVEERAHATGPLRLVFLANIVRGKGLHVLFESLRALPPISCELDVVGSCDVEPEYARNMRRRALGLGLPVRIHGGLDNQSLAGILQRAHVLVIPSQYEGFGIAYLEGMAHGLPALGTYVGALPELIADGVDGYLSSPGDVAALSGQISRLAGDRRLLARMGRAALEKYRTRPTWDAVTNQIREFLAAAVERWSAGAQA